MRANREGARSPVGRTPFFLTTPRAADLIRVLSCNDSVIGATAPRGQVAQLVEQRTENPRVVGSIPTLATIFPFNFPLLAIGLCRGSPVVVP